MIILPSLDKGRHGFDGQKWAHTASSPLTIRQVFSAGLSLSGRISAPAKLPAPDRNGFSSDFCFLRRRWAGAHQGEKSKKRRKDALSGVFALVKRWYHTYILERFSRKECAIWRKSAKIGMGVSSRPEKISAKTAPMNGLCPCVGEANPADPP